jgi:hypothetical protein
VLLKSIFESGIKALYLANLQSANATLEAAIEYHKYIANLKSANQLSFEAIRAEIYSQDVYRRNLAVKILIELDDRDALINLSQGVIQHSTTPQLSPSTLKQLWTSVPPTLVDLEDMIISERWERIPLIQAKISCIEQHDLLVFDMIGKYKDQNAMLAAFASVYRCKYAETILTKYMTHGFGENINDQPQYYPNIRLTASFFLALIGNQSGLSALLELAHNGYNYDAAYACYYLSMLATPQAITPVRHLLQSPDPEIVIFALLAAKNLSSNTLIPDLLSTVRRNDYCASNDSYIGDEALKVIRGIRGDILATGYEEFETGAIPPKYTQEYKESFITSAMSTFVPTYSEDRYRLGERITLITLVNDLFSPSANYREASAYSLQAITGEDHGFRLEDDLIENVEAILAWRERANNPFPLSPGGWSYMGNPIDLS